MPSQDYEKLGVFYLGKHFDLAVQQPKPDYLLYDAKDLTTHAVVVGMTGSGKTGLCLSLLEEAAIDGVPALIIDPKGDLGNLLLTFPQLKADDFRPWVDNSEATRRGLTPDQFAAESAKAWKDGLAAWDQDASRIKKFREACDVAIYTPGSQAGLPLTVVRSFGTPPQAVLDNSDAMRERVNGAAAGLLALLGIDADPIRSREHILLTNIFDRAWREKKDLDLGQLIREIQSPSFKKVGVLDLDTFYPATERFTLAMTLNNLLASPGFSAWMEGEALDIQRLLWSPAGKPRLSIMSISHLSDSERMFFVTIFLNEVLAWMRSQSGTSSLRCLLYMDEVFGYFPPTANPPSKTPMLTLLKQARAFGLGVVLATQNPVDLDYKGLSNCGTWFLGRLQTERDKARVLDGLEGASAST
ncbi:MAG: ATP-binding protein, partial [Planctomycetaceae bacterium]|nr:ATP-binding protein [Planctomycetaceae bacterium]